MKHFGNDRPFAREMNLAADAVRQAGLLCRAVQAEIDPGALAKQDRSPVTVADFGSQALICRAIREAFPDDPIIGEEDAAVLREPEQADMLGRVVSHVGKLLPDSGPEQVCAWIDLGGAKEYSPRFWTLDPIDGTKGFLRGGQYAIALALVIEGEVSAAVLGCPNLGPALDADRGPGSLFIAIKGQGAWQMPLLGEGDPAALAVSPQADPSFIRFCESVEAAHSSHGDTARIAERLDIQAPPARLDSQAKYAIVARGEAEAYLRLPRDAEYREKIWDHAAGLLVVTEAGGRVTDIAGRDLDFGLGYRLEKNRGVVATNTPVHDEILDTVKSLGIGQF
ncbi:MAG: 3'(2'),5'-bisphosphate nucleotidase [Candidatus Krumholzibacteriota bacterium]